MITFDAQGEPQPKGSMRAFVIAGRARLTSDNPKLKAWQKTVASTAWQHVPLAEAPPRHCPLTGPVCVGLTFRLPRPKALPKTRETPHVTRPDVDKLARGVLDALTGVIWVDDSQVAELTCAKRYAALGEPSGVSVAVWPSGLAPHAVREPNAAPASSPPRPAWHAPRPAIGDAPPDTPPPTRRRPRATPGAGPAVAAPASTPATPES